jgi:hypothetical protein
MFIQTLEDKALTVLQLGAYRRISFPERVSVSLKPMSQSSADIAGRPYTPQAEAMPSRHPHRLTTRVTFWGCMWRGSSLHRQRIQPRARTRRSPIVVKGWIGPNQGSLEDLEPRLCVTGCERAVTPAVPIIWNVNARESESRCSFAAWAHGGLFQNAQDQGCLP